VLQPSLYQPGDKVRHDSRPEWGLGDILRAEVADVDGVRCQRLTVRFDRAGIKTLLTSSAALSRAVAGYIPPDPQAAEDAGPFGSEPDYKEMLSSVPEAARDPFVSARKRLAATLDLYRFTSSGSSLLDWAAMQTQLKDPLSRFARHELEQHFQRFQRNLEEHLRRILRDVKKEDPLAIDQVVAAAPPAAKQAVRRADSSR
jgi:hypothetical protein